MGVPKFFRYISERYPCLSELAREQHIPEFDNLYLDMNGIIHNCSHPDDGNIHFKLSEEDMFTDIFNYIDKLFFLIKPQKLFFMAIDGVAPRAKMNQQRSRRFRSAKESEQLANMAKQRGENPPENRFDSNCITPGTEFMERLHAALRHFIKYKISCDPIWQKCRIILSGHDCPGEGEHKIMDYIRYLKSQPNYDAYTRHCLYGLDADLIILGLCTHEIHFAVLREEVKFGKKSKNKSVESTRFFLLHLGLMREYLEMEFNALRQVDENFDIANLIDDWVLMGFLVGNDFVPHLPCMHISTNALPLLYKTYIKVYPELGGNINVQGKLNLERLEIFIKALSEVEYEIFQENWTDLKYFEAKKTENGIDEAFDIDIADIKSGKCDEELAALIESSQELLSDGEEFLSDSQHIAEEFEKHKQNYYMNKLDDMNSEEKRAQVLSYITALQWILDYYYMGVQSWDWYYPYHYAPFISDLTNFKDFKIEFNLGKPFLPFAQLLAVLPAASKQLLPAAYHGLMTNTESELLHFYPTDFKTDLNGKQHEWEAVVLIPFIDEKILLSAMNRCEVNLKSKERKRNCHGPMHQYDFIRKSVGKLPADYGLPSLVHVFCNEQPIWSKDIVVSRDHTVCTEVPNLARHIFFPGFPTFQHLEYNFELNMARVRVFDFASRNENMIILPKSRPQHNNLEYVVENYLNKIVYIGWPHLIKTKVVGVSDISNTIMLQEKHATDAKTFENQVASAEEHLKTRMAIKVPDYDVLLHVNIYVGSNTIICNTTGQLVQEDIWSEHITSYPAQAVVSDITVHNNSDERYKRVEDLYKMDSMVFFIGSPYFGSQGTIIDPTLIYKFGRLKVNIIAPCEPNFEDARKMQYYIDQDYISAYEAAGILGISAKCLAKVTGSVLVIPGQRRILEQNEHVKKTNIGLELRFPKQNEERAGYARRMNHQWFYTNKAIELIQEYSLRYSKVIDYLCKSSERSDFCFESDIFTENAGKKIQEIETWLNVQEHINAERITSGAQLLAKNTVIKLLEAIEKLKILPVKTVTLQVKPHLLLKPDFTPPISYKAKCPIKLFDRVVIVKTTYMVPIGAKGTIIGIFPMRDPNPVRLECVGAVEKFYDVLFDKVLPSGHDVYGIAVNQVYRVPESSILLIFAQENATQQRRDNKVQTVNHKLKSVRNKVPEVVEASVNKKTDTKSNTKNYKEESQENITFTVMPSTSTGHNRVKGGCEYWNPSVQPQMQPNLPTAVMPTQNTMDKRFKPMISLNNNANGSQPQPSGVADFWMPTANTVKPNVEKIVINNSATNLMPFNKNVNVQNDCEAKTILLRNALKLPFNSTDTGTAAKIMPNLPQPPQYWKNEAKKYNELEKLNSTTNWYNPPADNSFFANFDCNNIQEFKPQVLQRRDGVFIPLQAMRNSKKKTVSTSVSSPKQTSDLSVPVRSKLDHMLRDMKINDIVNGSKPNHCQQQQIPILRAVHDDKKSPKAPKIAAKFDMA